jgi:adenylate kinase
LPKTFFVAGIHGAGKTTISRKLSAALPATQVSASALIQEAGRGRPVTVNAASKRVADVDSNQALLLRGLDAFRARTVGHIVLDGHLCLLSADGVISDVGLEVFRSIDPIAILLISSQAEVILSRLSGRAGDVPSLATIRLFSDREASRASLIADKLGKPLIQLRGDRDPDGAVEIAIEALRKVLVP